MNAVSVRLAGPEDAEGLVRAYEVSWDATLAPIVGTALGDLAPFDARLEQARASLVEPPEDARAWVAERSGDIVGMATVRGDELRALYVVPEAWGTGVGARLLESALAWLAEQGVAEAVLWVGEANARARRFYEREGWAADGATKEEEFRGFTLREVRYARGW